MAGFQGHITTSTALGIGLGFVGHWSGQFTDATCFIGGCLCSFAGMLPDLDSVNSRQHREIIGFLGAVVAAFTIQRLTTNQVSMDIAIVCASLLYLGIRFGLSWLIRTSTYHRGMFHSIPAAILSGEITFLLLTNTCSSSSLLFKSFSVVLGYTSHLILDEFCSVASNGRIKIKKSLGTAFKIFGRSPTVNLVMLAIILLLAEPIATTLNQNGLQLATSATDTSSSSTSSTSNSSNTESTLENTTKFQDFFASILGTNHGEPTTTTASSNTSTSASSTSSTSTAVPFPQYQTWAAQLTNRDNSSTTTSTNTAQNVQNTATDASRFLSQVLASQWIAGDNAVNRSDHTSSSLTAVSPTPLAAVSSGSTVSSGSAWQAGETLGTLSNVSSDSSRQNATINATSGTTFSSEAGGLVLSTLQSFLNRTSSNTVSYTEALTQPTPDTELQTPVETPSAKQAATWW